MYGHMRFSYTRTSASFEPRQILKSSHCYSEPEQEKVKNQHTCQLMQRNPATYKDRLMMLEGTIEIIQTHKEWFYYGCPTCKKKLKGSPSYLCGNHDTKGQYIVSRSTDNIQPSLPTKNMKRRKHNHQKNTLIRRRRSEEKERLGSNQQACV
ncbi:uncharacterized protein [Rutidosis leptorrhynchoides]|uniref:uncharacterized protein isoform X2 n=1 Tax=Rutidosis leptorrhynchoides TaxID=125765 RepID=UPI003A99E659